MLILIDNFKILIELQYSQTKINRLYIAKAIHAHNTLFAPSIYVLCINRIIECMYFVVHISQTANGDMKFHNHNKYCISTTHEKKNPQKERNETRKGKNNIDEKKKMFTLNANNSLECCRVFIKMKSCAL